MDLEDFEPKKKPDYEIGMDLSRLSVDELKALIETLRSEISRMEQMVAGKKSLRDSADSFFKS